MPINHFKISKIILLLAEEVFLVVFTAWLGINIFSI
jgi:hypothetical protein